jgi:hypothetical protein
VTVVRPVQSHETRQIACRPRARGTSSLTTRCHTACPTHKPAGGDHRTAGATRFPDVVVASSLVATRRDPFPIDQSMAGELRRRAREPVHRRAGFPPARGSEWMTTGVERHHSEWLTLIEVSGPVPHGSGAAVWTADHPAKIRGPAASIAPSGGSSNERRGGVDGAVGVAGSLAAQEALEIVWRHRPSEQVALPAGAVRSPQGRDLIGRLDALGDAPEA